MSKRGIPASVIVLLLLNEAFDAIAQFCFKRAAQRIGATEIRAVADAWAFSLAALSQGWLWAGVAVVAIVFLSWAIVLTKVDLSVAMPLTSISYVFVALAALLFLHEHISGLRWAGIGLILIGVAVVSASSTHSVPKP